MPFAKITADRNSRPRGASSANEGSYIYATVKSGVTLYKGELAVWETGDTGYVHFASNTAAEPFAGVAAETVIGDGTLRIKLWIVGEHYFIKGTPAITDDGVDFYCDGGGTGTSATIQSGDSTGLSVGVGRYDTNDSSGIWVLIDNYAGLGN